jgi:large repetitive protein
VTLYAQWTALPNHTVSFNTNGGSGSMSNQTANVATNLTANSFTRTGYTFAGWNTLAGGGGTAYVDQASYAFAADVTLYAQWTANVPTVTGISPNAGPLAGGTSLTITGSNFTGATSVTIGGTAATGLIVVNATTITATTPAHAAGTVDVVVTTPGGTGTGTGLFTYATVPGAPTGVTATGGNGQATITFTAPASNGGSAITTYTATSSPGGHSGSCAGPAACSITVTGLTNGTAYTFTVTATNAFGTGASSIVSNSVTPQAAAATTGIPTLSPTSLLFLTGLLALVTLFATKRPQ